MLCNKEQESATGEVKAAEETAKCPPENMSPHSNQSLCNADEGIGTPSPKATPQSPSDDFMFLQDHIPGCYLNSCDSSFSSENGTNDKKAQTAQSTVIPEGTRPLDHQVGGHLYQNGKIGFLADSVPGVVLKPIQSFPRGMIECAFYSRVFSQECADPALLSLRKFMPIFHGVVHLPENGVSYMRLEDVTSLVEPPAAIMDVKMGRHTWDPRSSPEKRKRADGKYPYAAQLGFQITGFKTSVSDGETGSEVKHFFADYTRKVTPDQLIPKVFRLFFGGQRLRRASVERTIARLCEIGNWFRSQRSFCFYSASLLLVHSTEVSSPSDPEGAFADVKFVDFAHVYPANGQLDENFLHGVDTLIIYLKQLLNEADSQQQ